MNCLWISLILALNYLLGQHEMTIKQGKGSHNLKSGDMFEPQTALHQVPEPPYARVLRESSQAPEHRSIPSAPAVSVQLMLTSALCDVSRLT